ncbi:MAG: hypothetical protein F7C32_02745 [Desulfurococcales archaeon]|nr:hypothetical protein [Desulfurococcales archaeon]
MRHILIPIMLALLIVAVTTAYTVTSQSNEQEAQQAFENAGCTACHSWDEVTGTITSWAQTYDNIDSAALTEYGKDFNGLMQDMRSFAPSLTDDQYQLLHQYFLDLFQANQPTTNETTGNETNQTSGGGGQPPTNETNQTTGNETNATCQQPPPQECECNETNPPPPQVITEKEYYVVNQTKVELATVEENQTYSPTPGTATYVPAVAAILVLAGLAYMVWVVRK